jgi:hypothetical protein
MKVLPCITIIFISCISLLSQEDKTAINNDILDLKNNSLNIYADSPVLNSIRRKEEQLKFSVEYLGVDRRNNIIVKRKLEYPIKQYKKIISNKGLIELPWYIYYYSFEIPIENYNQRYSSSFEKSELFGKNRRIQIFMRPNLSGGYLIIIGHDIEADHNSSCQFHAFFDFEKERIFKTTLTSRLGAANLITSFLQNNVWKYVDEYLIISLEK